MQLPVIKNSKGEQIILNDTEKHNCQWMARTLYDQHGPKGALKNSVGYEVAITTLTTITKKVSEQKFYTVKPSDFIPVIAGQGTWSSNLETYRAFDVASPFEDGIVDTGGNNDRLSAADAAVDALNIKIYNWAKSMAYSIFDLELAAKSGNWDLVAAKEKSRKRNFDLGIQKVAFLGLPGQNASGGSCLGLLNQPGITFDAATITQSLSSMSYTQIQAFLTAVMAAYQNNNALTAFPTHFAIPQSDFNGLVNSVNPEFPIKTRFEFLDEAFKTITANPNFKILPLAYGDKTYSGLSTQVYALYNYDEESLNMNVPLPYTTSLSNSLNSFQFSNVGYAQFTGVLTLRPLELYYMGF